MASRTDYLFHAQHGHAGPVAGGLLNVVRWASFGRSDVLLGFGVGGGDADEDGGPGAIRSPVLSELG